ncbi:TetR/AcrR family transcriptional regulator [uncultured Campylobacter sp.]|jgi:SNF7 family protein|uniref:TetR/AcrR family transcriptional regulator n=1 Tax=uncultured Campylobacter sp. TaxID=218934 RepID=UPI00263564C0|nr:TetR/AcrR family transcriptional regulator [uncultured Campylobacter sp.]
MEKKEIANLLEIELRTLYNWEKNRPTLYKFIVENIDKTIEKDSKFNELKEYFEKLTEKEQEFYLSNIKITVLKKELGQ